jgi:membrane protein involved in colicin uptake
MTEATNTANAEADAAAKKAAADKEKAEKAAAKKAEKAAASAAKKAEREAAKTAKKAEKEAAKAANKQPTQNDITRPKAGTITGKLWDTFDTLSRETGLPATIGDAMKRSEGTAEATVRTQYARWRKFNGVTGRAAAPAKSEGAPSA